MGRNRNLADSTTVTISVTPQVKSWLEDLAKAGPFGKNASEVATRIVDARIQQFLEQGRFIRLNHADDTQSD